MRLTPRDVRLVRDLALSHTLSRDQILALGYFSSVTRANTRLRALRATGLVKCLDTPFYSQTLYAAGPLARVVVGDRIGPLIANRSCSPRFLRHALSVTNTRIALEETGCEWRFEQQLWSTVRFLGTDHQVRPDGLLLSQKSATFIEVDLGHIAPAKFREKLKGYEAFVASGACAHAYPERAIRLLTITTGQRRLRSLRCLIPSTPLLEASFHTFAELKIPLVGSWS